jgi:hypothetical protein
MLTVQWIKSKAGSWLDLETFDLSSVQSQTFGVYVIWHRGNPSRVVTVGQGKIAERLGSHRSDSAILKYSSLGMNVTWASVSASQADGVERYLADRCRPLVGDRYPAAAPIVVNLPEW